jgi:hypothetical protein
MAATAPAKAAAAEEATVVHAAEEKARFEAEKKNRKNLQEKAEAEEPNHAPTLALILINPNPNCNPIPDSRRNRRLKPRRKLRCKP